MTGPSAVALHLQLCSTTYAIAAAQMSRRIPPDGPVCSKLMPNPATIGSTLLIECRPILEAACWEYARRTFLALADIEASVRRKAEGKMPAPISSLAHEAVRRMDRLFEIERGINGKSADERRAIR